MASPKCQLCKSPDEERDWAIISGLRSFDELSSLLGASRSVVDRHLNHIEVVPARAREFRSWLAQRHAKAPAAALETRMLARLDESPEAIAPTVGQVFHRLFELEGAALKLLGRAEAEGQIRDGISAIRACESLVTRAAELAGMLKSGTNVAVGVVVDAGGDDFDAQVNALLAEISAQSLPMCSRCGEGCSACASEALPVGSIEALQAAKAALARDRRPGGAETPVEDAEVVEDAFEEASSQTPTQRALPPPCAEGCGCYKHQGASLSRFAAGPPGPVGISDGRRW